MKHLFIILSCLLPSLCSAQTFSGEYTAEWQWDMKRNTNWLNLLRLNLEPNVVYRITALAYGRKPGTMAVLQQTYVRQVHKGDHPS